VEIYKSPVHLKDGKTYSKVAFVINIIQPFVKESKYLVKRK